MDGASFVSKGSLLPGSSYAEQVAALEEEEEEEEEPLANVYLREGVSSSVQPIFEPVELELDVLKGPVLQPKNLNSGNLHDTYLASSSADPDLEVLEISYVHRGRKVEDSILVDKRYGTSGGPRILVSAQAVKVMHKVIRSLTQKIDSCLHALRECRYHYYKEHVLLKDLVFLKKREEKKQKRDNVPVEHMSCIYNPVQYQDKFTVQRLQDAIIEGKRELEKELAVSQSMINKFQSALFRKEGKDMPVEELASASKMNIVEEDLQSLKQEHEELIESHQEVMARRDLVEKQAQELQVDLDTTRSVGQKQLERHETSLRKVVDARGVLERTLASERLERKNKLASFVEAFEKLSGLKKSHSHDHASPRTHKHDAKESPRKDHNGKPAGRKDKGGFGTQDGDKKHKDHSQHSVKKRHSQEGDKHSKSSEEKKDREKFGSQTGHSDGGASSSGESDAAHVRVATSGASTLSSKKKKNAQQVHKQEPTKPVVGRLLEATRSPEAGLHESQVTLLVVLSATSLRPPEGRRRESDVGALLPEGFAELQVLRVYKRDPDGAIVHECRTEGSVAEKLNILAGTGLQVTCRRDAKATAGKAKAAKGKSGVNATASTESSLSAKGAAPAPATASTMEAAKAEQQSPQLQEMQQQQQQKPEQQQQLQQQQQSAQQPLQQQQPPSQSTPGEPAVVVEAIASPAEHSPPMEEATQSHSPEAPEIGSAHDAGRQDDADQSEKIETKERKKHKKEKTREKHLKDTDTEKDTENEQSEVKEKRKQKTTKDTDTEKDTENEQSEAKEKKKKKTKKEKSLEKEKSTGKEKDAERKQMEAKGSARSQPSGSPTDFDENAEAQPQRSPSPADAGQDDSAVPAESPPPADSMSAASSQRRTLPVGAFDPFAAAAAAPSPRRRSQNLSEGKRKSQVDQSLLTAPSPDSNAGRSDGLSDYDDENDAKREDQESGLDANDLAGEAADDGEDSRRNSSSSQGLVPEPPKFPPSGSPSPRVPRKRSAKVSEEEQAKLDLRAWEGEDTEDRAAYLDAVFTAHETEEEAAAIRKAKSLQRSSAGKGTPEAAEPKTTDIDKAEAVAEEPSFATASNASRKAGGRGAEEESASAADGEDGHMAAVDDACDGAGEDVVGDEAAEPGVKSAEPDDGASLSSDSVPAEAAVDGEDASGQRQEVAKDAAVEESADAEAERPAGDGSPRADRCSSRGRSKEGAEASEAQSAISDESDVESESASDESAEDDDDTESRSASTSSSSSRSSSSTSRSASDDAHGGRTRRVGNTGGDAEFIEDLDLLSTKELERLLGILDGRADRRFEGSTEAPVAAGGAAFLKPGTAESASTRAPSSQQQSRIGSAAARPQADSGLGATRPPKQSQPSDSDEGSSNPEDHVGAGRRSLAALRTGTPALREASVLTTKSMRVAQQDFNLLGGDLAVGEPGPEPSVASSCPSVDGGREGCCARCGGPLAGGESSSSASDDEGAASPAELLRCARCRGEESPAAQDASPGGGRVKFDRAGSAHELSTFTLESSELQKRRPSVGVGFQQPQSISPRSPQGAGVVRRRMTVTKTIVEEPDVPSFHIGGVQGQQTDASRRMSVAARSSGRRETLTTNKIDEESLAAHVDAAQQTLWSVVHESDAEGPRSSNAGAAHNLRFEVIRDALQQLQTAGAELRSAKDKESTKDRDKSAEAAAERLLVRVSRELLALCRDMCGLPPLSPDEDPFVRKQEPKVEEETQARRKSIPAGLKKFQNALKKKTKTPAQADQGEHEMFPLGELDALRGAGISTGRAGARGSIFRGGPMPDFSITPSSVTPRRKGSIFVNDVFLFDESLSVGPGGSSTGSRKKKGPFFDFQSSCESTAAGTSATLSQSLHEMNLEYEGQDASIGSDNRRSRFLRKTDAWKSRAGSMELSIDEEDPDDPWFGQKVRLDAPEVSDTPSAALTSRMLLPNHHMAKRMESRKMRQQRAEEDTAEGFLKKVRVLDLRSAMEYIEGGKHDPKVYAETTGRVPEDIMERSRRWLQKDERRRMPAPPPLPGGGGHSRPATSGRDEPPTLAPVVPTTRNRWFPGESQGGPSANPLGALFGR